MKNIAILIPTLKEGGAEKQSVLLALTLQNNHNVHFFVLYDIDSIATQNKALLDRSRVTIHSMSGSLMSKLSQLKREFKANSIDVLFNYLTSCNVVGAIAGRMAGVKKIYGGIRNTHLEWHKIIVERFIHNHIASGTIYNCYTGAAYFESRGFLPNRNMVIPNCFLDIAPTISRGDRPIKHIITVGRFVPQKDYKTLIRTISMLKSSRRDFVMDIVGYGEEEINIRKWIVEYEVSDIINIFIKPSNVQDILRDADIYLSTSLFEGTSNSIMEALNWSLPIVATNVGDNEYLVCNNINGMLHHTGDVNGIAHSLRTLLDSVELRRNYGLNSNKILRDNYNAAIFEKRYMNLISVE